MRGGAGAQVGAAMAVDVLRLRCDRDVPSAILRVDSRFGGRENRRRGIRTAARLMLTLLVAGASLCAVL